MNRSPNRMCVATLAGRLSMILALACGLLTVTPPSFAAEPPAANPDAGKRFGTLWKLRGEVTAAGPGGERRLQEGDVVMIGERVRAAAAAEAVLRTDDAGIVAVRPGAEFVVERFAAQGRPSDGFTVRLITGSLRVITGWIGRLNRADHKVVTPTATIGIRGTDHEPYVLSAELAASTANKEGSYDKVNRGGTTMTVGDNKLDIDSGRVGFVRAAERPFKTRALMTILLPVLLDKVPSFYVPGEFDAELDLLSKTADEDSQKALEQKRKGSDTPPAKACAPQSLAKAWLAQLDAAVSQADAPRIIALFAPEVAVRANVRGQDGALSSLDLGRDELAQSTVAAVKGLKGYRHRRISIEAKPAEGEAGIACARLTVKSVVIEQGRQAGKPYRFESTEDFVLELRDGKWLAVKAETTQR